MPKFRQHATCCSALLFGKQRPPTLLIVGVVLWWATEFTALLLLCWLLGWTVHRGFRLEPVELPHYALRYAGCWLLTLAGLLGSTLLTLGRWIYYSLKRSQSPGYKAAIDVPP